MERLTGVEGATGLFSVVDGQVVRSTRVVRIQDRSLEPESAGWPATFDIPADSIGLAPDAETLGVPSGTDSIAVPDTGTAPGR